MKYYKITNEEENHYDLQYKKGVVKDILPFYPSGNCTPGGIYFASRDILAFIDFGPWIREVTPISEIYENPGLPKKYKAHKVKLSRRRRINFNIIKKLVKEGANIHTCNNKALCWAAENGHLDIVKFLIKKGANIHSLNDYSLRYAAVNGHLDIVKFLVENGADVDTVDNYSEFLILERCHFKTLDYLDEIKQKQEEK